MCISGALETSCFHLYSHVSALNIGHLSNHGKIVNRSCFHCLSGGRNTMYIQFLFVLTVVERQLKYQVSNTISNDKHQNTMNDDSRSLNRPAG